MNSKKLKVAVIGCGRMGLHHVKAIGVVETAELVAVADPHVDPVAVRDSLPAGTAVYTDVAAMLREARPDVVHVVTPPGTHVELATLALEQGAHVYVEKPFALAAAEARSIVELAKRKDRKLCAGHQVLFQDSGKRYRETMPLIGDVVHVESYFSFKTVRRAAGGGAVTPTEQLIDILPHPVYLLLSAFESAGRDMADVELRSVEVDARGEVRALLSCGDAMGVLTVTLRGRPIESYVRVVGSNGLVLADFVISGVVKLVGPGASIISAVINPFSRARQIAFGTIGNVFRMLFRKHKSYAGLAELVGAFYRSILESVPSPVSDRAIVETVRLCELIGSQLEVASVAAEQAAGERLVQVERQLLPPERSRGVVLVTGGTGFLGRVFVEELRGRGWPVRVLARRVPSASMRVPGVEYVLGDIGATLAPDVFQGVSVVAHLAAETQGKKDAHERNTVRATRTLVDAMARAGVKKLVHISSIAILKPRRPFAAALTESAPVDRDNLGRGPYVWAKAEAEAIVQELCAKHGISTRVIRLGALVDFEHFAAPGRLGREVGPLYVAMGSRGEALSLCDVRTASNVIRHYVEAFDQVPAMLNLVEAQQSTRGDLVKRLRAARPDLAVMWLPMAVVWSLSAGLGLIMKVLRPGKKALDLYSAFMAERYDNTLASRVIADAALAANAAPSVAPSAVAGGQR